jgi:uncharacterized protein
MRILRVVFVLALLAGVGPRAHAEDTPSPEALQAANELFTIMSGDMLRQLTSQMMNAFWPALEQKVRSERIDDATIAELKSEMESIQLAFVTEAVKEAPPIYARHFTVAELKELMAFYRSPVGAKALRELPQVMGEFTTLLMQRLPAVQGQIGEAFNRILRAHGYVK